MSKKPKVLISDKIDQAAIDIFKEQGCDVDYKPGLTPDELKKIIKDYDGLAIRSATKVTEDIIKSAKNLKVVGRAGIGVDNVDVPAATKAGIVVMNTPFGNSVTTAEHTFAMLMSLARHIPQANAQTHKGEWPKTKYGGTELKGKTIGIIGCGNIGSIVAKRAQGFEMKVIGFDPFLTLERAVELSIEKCELDDLLSRSDVITIHTPLNDHTLNILNKDTLSKTKKGVMIINCARGGLIDEDALKDALDSGHVGGAALDVFENEPATTHPLFGYDNVVCTPHLAASTSEAQVAVALQVAQQMSAYLIKGAVENALNLPSISATDAPVLMPYIKLANALGIIASNLTKEAGDIEITYAGEVSKINVKPLTCEIVAGYLSKAMDDVNRVNAPSLAADRGIKITESTTEKADPWLTSITVKNGSHKVIGSIFGTNQARIVAIDDVGVEAPITSHMLMIRNTDKPGLIGQVGSILGQDKINISDFRLGADSDGHAICLVATDKAINNNTLKMLRDLSLITQIDRLSF